MSPQPGWARPRRRGRPDPELADLFDEHGEPRWHRWLNRYVDAETAAGLLLAPAPLWLNLAGATGRELREDLDTARTVRRGDVAALRQAIPGVAKLPEWIATARRLFPDLQMPPGLLDLLAAEEPTAASKKPPQEVVNRALLELAQRRGRPLKQGDDEARAVIANIGATSRQRLAAFRALPAQLRFGKGQR